jgi:mannose-6-phosphate isomerase
MSAPSAQPDTSGSASSPSTHAPGFDRRPWGTYQVLDEGATFKVKRLTVDPGQRLSYQFHERRAEHWVVVAGRARVTLDDTVHELEPGASIDIPRRGRHRVENPAEPGGEILTFIEVQQGDYFGEDDIIRLDDDYGRGGG